jgi:hypothetical protein
MVHISEKKFAYNKERKLFIRTIKKCLDESKPIILKNQNH